MVELWRYILIPPKNLLKNKFFNTLLVCQVAPLGAPHHPIAGKLRYLVSSFTSSNSASTTSSLASLPAPAPPAGSPSGAVCALYAKP